MENIDQLVDQTLKGRPEAAVQTKKPKHTKRFFIKIGPMGLGLIAVATSMGMLVGLLFTIFNVNILSTVTVNGTQEPLFEFNGQDFQTPYLNLTEAFSIDAGQTITRHNFLINKDAGAWTVNISMGDRSFESDPYHEFYGLNRSVENIELNGVPTTAMILSPGDNLSWDFVWYAHHEMVTPDDPFESEISIVLERLPEPLAVDDLLVGTVHYGVPDDLVIHPLLNDEPDWERSTFEIQSITPGSVIAGDPTHWIISIDPTNQFVTVYYAGSYHGVADFTYTLVDKAGQTDVGLVTFNVIGN